MKKIFVFVAACVMVTGILFALKAHAAEKGTLKGVVVDNLFADEHAKDIASFVRSYSKQEAVKNAFSGYSLYTSEGKIYKFDPPSCAKVEEYVKKEGSSLQVTVTAEIYGDDLTLISISQG